MKSYATPEDQRYNGNGKVSNDHPDVARVRRAHLNDLENIVPFLVLAFFYLTTGPSAIVAKNLIRAYAALRFAHTFFYLFEVIN